MSDLIKRQDAIEKLECFLMEKALEDQNHPSAEARTQMSSADCISRQDAIDVCNCAIDLWENCIGQGALIAVKKKIENLPSAERKGKWIEHENPKDVFSIECSECGCWFLHEHLVRNSYCPNCGARMEGE